MTEIGLGDVHRNLAVGRQFEEAGGEARPDPAGPPFVYCLGEPANPPGQRPSEEGSGVRRPKHGQHRGNQGDGVERLRPAVGDRHVAGAFARESQPHDRFAPVLVAPHELEGPGFDDVDPSPRVSREVEDLVLGECSAVDPI